MPGLLKLPIELLRRPHALQGLVDALSARNRPRFESTVLINAPREAVRRTIADPATADSARPHSRNGAAAC